MYWNIKEKLENEGYIHYEISNFAKKGYESKHNTNCWDQEEYIGFGVAAHSYINNKRISNTENIENYIELIEMQSFDKLKTVNEIQDNEAKMKEYMMLGLRKIDGIKISKFKEKYVQNPIYIFRKELNKLVREELIETDLDSIKLSKKGLDLANQVWIEFV